MRTQFCVAIRGRYSDSRASDWPTERGFPDSEEPSAIVRWSFPFTAAGQFWIRTRFPEPVTGFRIATPKLQCQGIFFSIRLVLY